MTDRFKTPIVCFIVAVGLSVLMAAVTEGPEPLTSKAKAAYWLFGLPVRAFGLGPAVMGTMAAGTLLALMTFPWPERKPRLAKPAPVKRKTIPNADTRPAVADVDEEPPMRRTRTFGRAGLVQGAGLAGGDDLQSTPDFQEPKQIAELLEAIARDNVPSPMLEGSLPPKLDAARRRPIVFRQDVPSDEKGRLSFYGGRPIVPPGFAWPRSPVAGRDKWLHFLMQWDCRELSVQDATGLLPKDGVLYFFIDFEWGVDDGFRFIHCPGPADGWAPLDPPATLGPIHGDRTACQIAGCTSQVDGADTYVPRLMPYAAFTPVAFDYPNPATTDPDDEEEHLFWDDGARTREALLAVQNAGGSAVAVRDHNAPAPPFARPFAAFPHDFGSIRVVAAQAIEALASPHSYLRREKTPDGIVEDAKEERLDTWLAEAKELYLYAAAQPLSAAVSIQLADQVWAWIEELEPVFASRFDNLVVRAIDLSLGYASDAMAAIPQDWIDRAARRRALAHEYDREEQVDHSQPNGWTLYEEKKARGELEMVRVIHAPTPNRMFGPPSYVQGYVEDFVGDHLLLLEITSGGGPGHDFGEGVLQYLITPDDLGAGRFDKMRAVLSSY